MEQKLKMYNIYTRGLSANFDADVKLKAWGSGAALK